MFRKYKQAWLVLASILIIIGVATASIIAAGQRKVEEKEQTVEIQYGDSKPATINVDGEDKTVDVPTVEAITVSGTNQEVEEGLEAEASTKGAYNVDIDITTPDTVRATTMYSCINYDGAYGSQCVDLIMAISAKQTGSVLSTCGTGAARGMMDCWQQNAGEDYDVIWNSNQIRPGDILVFDGGEFGHTGMALGYYNNGYVTLLGQNQGGNRCEGGGSSTNIINMNLRQFKGAYRWKGWNSLFIKPIIDVKPPETGRR